ncbi:MAG: HNH endonuclease [Dehalococcoidia bacterium]
MKINRRRIGAHRIGYALQIGPIPNGLRVLHHCDTPLCIRGEHLFLGTDRDNHRDSAAKGRRRSQNSGKSRCRHGHLFNEVNTYVWNNGRRIMRQCRTCNRENHQRERLKGR